MPGGVDLRRIDAASYTRPMRAALVILALVISSCGGTGVLEVTDAWAGSTPPGADVAAIYVAITNDTGADETIATISVQGCAAVEIHATSLDEENVMRMRPATPQALMVPAGGELAMVPGSMHVMCIRPDRDFVEGETIPFEIMMQSGSVLTGTATIENR